ncbi:hypothetical protein WA538_005579 [Blastocystis sp. DL]
MPTTKQLRNSYSSKMEHRKNRKQAQRNNREGKIRRIHKDLGLPHFGEEKRKLENRNKMLKEKLNKAIEEKGDAALTPNPSQPMSLESMIQQAQMKTEKFSEEMKLQKEEFETQFVKEDNAAAQTRRAFFHQLKEVINRSDVLIIVLDARDPMGCRSKLIERKILEKDPNKRIILLINKIDLVPKHIAMMWLSLLRQEYPTILFKASTQSQRSHLGRNDMDIRKANSSVISSNVCLGADSVLQLLKNYCRNNGVKTAITVGVIGYPNVGKSSFINSLKRSRAVGVSSTAGYTRSIQEIQIDRNISLLDCPGVIFNSGSSSYLLRNCVDVHELDDPEGVVERMMQSLRNSCQYLQAFYQIPAFGSVRELLAYVARARGKLKKGGVPDMRAAACVIIQDFNQGMIPFYMKPPKRMLEQMNKGLQIVNDWSTGFDMKAIDDDNLQAVQIAENAFDDDKYLVLDAEEEEEEDVDIPILNRHLAHREMEGESRIASKEDIMKQRQEMLEEELMKENEEQDQYEEADDRMDEENYDYSTAFFQ